MVARRAHNPKVVGSNPASATRKKPLICNKIKGFCFVFLMFSAFQPNFAIFLIFTKRPKKGRFLLFGKHLGNTPVFFRDFQSIFRHMPGRIFIHS